MKEKRKKYRRFAKNLLTGADGPILLLKPYYPLIIKK